MFLASLTRLQKEAFFCLAHNVVVSDGELSAGEREMMQEMRTELGIPPAFEPRYIPLAGIEDVFDTRRSRIIALLSLIRLGWADGAFEIEEQCLLDDVRRAFGVSDTEFGVVRSWVQRLVSLEREAQLMMAAE
ncbi:MAG: hypothetical protein ACFHX7_19525 [Pseudomonadota bacterium]